MFIVILFIINSIKSKLGFRHKKFSMDLKTRGISYYIKQKPGPLFDTIAKVSSKANMEKHPAGFSWSALQLSRLSYTIDTVVVVN